jgi:hypothetical protein
MTRLLMSARNFFVVLSVIIAVSSQTEKARAENAAFACGGEVEKKVYGIWAGGVKTQLADMLQHRLVEEGDVYALYDFQINIQNMVSMAQRCNRNDRLREVARLIEVAYGSLESDKDANDGREWVCRGGSICNDKNRLKGTEIILCSAQFLGLATSVANSLATAKGPLNEEDKVFVQNTLSIATEHLRRWSQEGAIANIQKATSTGISEMTPHSSSALFTDKHLWLITIYSELSGILNSPHAAELTKLSAADKAQFSRHLQYLLKFFNTRLTMLPTKDKSEMADLDRGFWWLHPDNAYSGYQSPDKPVVCVKSHDKKAPAKLKYSVSRQSAPKRKDIGWDFSHARRLVQALDAIQRNRQSLVNVYGLNRELLPRPDLPAAFANTVVSVIWNGDKEAPLFANYWSGANGWYRVAYDNRTDQCREGTPPYGLSASFPTGGFVTWAKYNATIGVLGERLYKLFQSGAPNTRDFIKKYYPGFSATSNEKERVMSNFMFLPSLVGVSIK